MTCELEPGPKPPCLPRREQIRQLSALRAISGLVRDMDPEQARSAYSYLPQSASRAIMSSSPGWVFFPTSDQCSRGRRVLVVGDDLEPSFLDLKGRLRTRRSRTVVGLVVPVTWSTFELALLFLAAPVPMDLSPSRAPASMRRRARESTSDRPELVV